MPMSKLQALEELHIDCFKTPPRPAKLGRLTAQLVGNVLDQLNYGGDWKITFLQRVRKKSDVRFQILNRRENEIFLRTKPGNNDTTWEIKLSPPSGYLIQDIFDNLKRVPSSGIMRRIPQPTPLIPTNSPKIPVIHYTTVAATVEKEVSVSIPELVTPPVSTPPEPVQKELPPLVTSIKEEPAPPPTIVQKDQQQMSVATHPPTLLAITKDTRDVGKNSQALTNGLVAICCSVSQEGHIERTKAVSVLIQEMDLKEFIKLHPTYTSAKKVASMILKGLCDRGQISRYSPTRKFNRVRDTTKGYVLTPLGRAKIKAVHDKLPESIKNRLFSELPPIKPFVSSEASFEKLTTLTEQLIKTQKSLSEYNAIHEELQFKKLEFEQKTIPARQQIENLREQMAAIAKEIEYLNNEISGKNLTEINREIHECLSMIDSENHEIERIKKQIIDLMG